MVEAVCIRCGNPKDSPFALCANCGLDPNGDPTTEAQSLILSTRRYADGTDRLRYARELEEIGEKLRRGETFFYSKEEIKQLLEERTILAQPLTVPEFAKIVFLILLFLAIPMVAVVVFFLRS